MPILKDLALRSLKCPAGKKQIEVFDEGCVGLSIRVSAGGTKAWGFTYTSPRGGRARVSLGTYPATGLEAARDAARKNRGQVEAGTDPRDAAAAVKPKTIAQLIEERLAMKVRGKKRTSGEIEWRYGKYVTPVVGNVAVRDFQIDPHYNLVIDPILKRGCERMAGVVYQDLNTLFNFAIQRGVIEYSRLAKVERPDTKVVRSRFLSCDEIVTVWNSLPTALAMSKNTQRILKLLLVLGQRETEVAGMRRSEIDRIKQIWTIPAARVKNGEKYGDHKVPLSALAMSIIDEAWKSTNGEFLFPNLAADGHLPGMQISFNVARACDPKPGLPLGRLGVAKWTPHDLRRTVGTQMLNRENGLGISKFQKYLVLNHRSALKGNVSDEVYDHNDYLEEMREAIVKWGEFLTKLVGAETEQREAA